MIKAPLHIRSTRHRFTMPKIYISKITLSDYSNDKSSKSFRSEILTGLDPSSLRSDTGDNVDSSKKVKAHVSMVAYLTEAQVYRFSKGDMGKIRVIKNESPELQDSISNNPSEWITPGGLLYDVTEQTKNTSYTDIPYNQMFKSVGDLRGRNDFAIKENNKSSIVKQQNFNKIMFSNGISLYEVPYEASFVLDYSQIRNLSFYVFPIADIESVRGYGSVTRKVSVGPITSEIVYVEGNKTKNCFAFETQKGEYWTGPVHYHEQVNTPQGIYTGWMAGTELHMRMGMELPKLEQVVIENNKIVDKRMGNVIKNMSFDLYRKNKFFRNSKKMQTIARTNKSEREFERRKNVVSDINYSFDGDDNARFIFHVNMAELIKEATKFPELIEQIKLKDSQLYSSILSSYSIQKVKIYRQVLKNNMSSNRITSPSIDPSYSQEELIFESGGLELEQNTVLYEGPFGSLNRGTLGAKQSPISTLKRVNLKISNSSEIASYTGIDFQAKNQGDAKYQYSVELLLEDPVVSYLNSAIAILNNILDGNNTSVSLEQYYEESIAKKSFYNEKLGCYTQEYLTDYTEKYYTEEVDYIENIVQSFVGVLSLFNTGNSYKRQSDEQTSLSDIQEIYKYLTLISSPYTGNPDGVLELISLVKATKNNLLKTRSSAYSMRKNVKDNKELESSANPNSSREPRSITYRQEFKNVLDMSKISSGKFYEFIKISRDDTEKNQDGLFLLDANYFADRVDMEARMFFGNSEGPLAIRDKNENIYNPSDSIERNKFSFLSPTRIILDKDRQVETYSKFSFSENLEEMNSALNEILTHNHYNSTERGLDAMIQNGLSFRTKKEKDYQSQKNQTKLQEVFRNSSSDTLYSDEPELFSKRENQVSDSTNSEAGGNQKSLINSINQVRNSNILSHSNTTKFYDLNQSEGALSIKKKTASQGRNDRQLSSQGRDSFFTSQNDLVNAPNQMKSLVSLITSPQSGNRGILNSEETVGKDFLRDPSKQGYVYFNYKKLVKIEVLRGFKSDGDSQNTTSPVWSTIRQEDLNSRSNSLLYCRMVEYENVDLGYQRDKNLSLPMKNQYFLINTTGKVMENIPLISAGNRQDIQKSYRNEYAKGLQKSMQDFRDQRKKVFGNKNRVAKPAFFETNIGIKTNQPFANLDEFQSYQSSNATGFENQTESERIDRLERGGYGDLLKGRKRVTSGTTRGLQRTTPVGQTTVPVVQAPQRSADTTSRQTTSGRNNGGSY